MYTEDGFVVAAMVGQGKKVGYVAHLEQRSHVGERCQVRERTRTSTATIHTDGQSLVSYWHGVVDLLHTDHLVPPLTAAVLEVW